LIIDVNLAFVALLDFRPELALLNHMLIQGTQLYDLETVLACSEHDALFPEVHVELVGVQEVVVHFSAELALHVVFLFDRTVRFGLGWFRSGLRAVFGLARRFLRRLRRFWDLSGLFLGVFGFGWVD
jgi:hypothetical protein